MSLTTASYANARTVYRLQKTVALTELPYVGQVLDITRTELNTLEQTVYRVRVEEVREYKGEIRLQFAGRPLFMWVRYSVDVG